jgi:site-specific DNA recombinase
LKTKQLRVVGYCRTSGEGQRDNTSIPTQKKCTEEFCKRNDWRFLSHYVDESKSGAKIGGRTEFQRMLKDAALEKFDTIIAFDVTRFARDGVDILTNAKFLRENYGVYFVDTKGSFDSRPGGNILLNFVHAGVSEYERMQIMGRTTMGRIQKARDGEPWSAHLPFGRGYDKNTKKWFITERGHRYRQLVERYVAGEGFNDLVTGDFPEFKSAQFANFISRRSQLAGTYVKTFESKELNIRETVSIPAIPEVLSVELAKKLRERMEHRRTCNKEDFQKYLLTGYVRCGHCGKFLSGSIVKAHTYHRHHAQNAGSPLCVFYAIREDQLVPAVLDYLFRFFTDEAAYNAAVAQAFPDPKQRAVLERDREELKSKLDATEAEIRRLVNAIKKGADPQLLIESQNELRERKEQEQARLLELDDRLENMPSKEVLEREAMTLRLKLLKKVQNRDWRTMGYDEIRRYLIFLFGENPTKTGYGIKVRREGKRWVISFNGRFCFDEIHDGYPTMHAVAVGAKIHNREAKAFMAEARAEAVRNLKSNTDFRERRIR